MCLGTRYTWQGGGKFSYIITMTENWTSLQNHSPPPWHHHVNPLISNQSEELSPIHAMIVAAELLYKVLKQ